MQGRIDWVRVQEELCPEISLQELAEVSKTMANHVESGFRKFSKTRQEKIIMKLIVMKNFQGKGHVINEAKEIMKVFKRNLEQSYPLWSEE